MQERIVSFLVLCCLSILHDKTLLEILSTPVRDEPPFSELSHQGNFGYTGFSEAVVVAPYRNRGVLEMTRLQDYVGAAYNDAKDHLWALREDPSYLSETIMDMSNQRPEDCHDVLGQMDPSIDTPFHPSAVLNRMIVESYTRLYLWHEPDLRLAAVDLCFQGSSTNKQKLEAGLKFESFARECLLTTAETLRQACLDMPTMRTRYIRVPGREGTVIKLCCHRCFGSLAESML
jgi:hypothetical protein